MQSLQFVFSIGKEVLHSFSHIITTTGVVQKAYQFPELTIPEIVDERDDRNGVLRLAEAAEKTDGAGGSGKSH